jgi:pantoate--beta-alanine ligase
MQIFNEIEPLRAFLSRKKAEQLSIGLVATMGALHEGHLFLIKSSKAENQLTVATIYVNPTQFNNPGDLEKYPRPLEKDIVLLREGGCDILFCPNNLEMYSRSGTLKFDFGLLDKILEGEFRPGHFSGVALVVSKLFNIVQPSIAYFGQKDFQQFMIISRLVEELKFAIQLRCIPTLREPDGLAMSSRNLRLNEQERKKAVVLHRSLLVANQELKDGKSISEVKRAIGKIWEAERDIQLEYFAVAERENFILLDSVNSAIPSIMLIAGMVGDIRLIDNMMVG